MWMLWSTVSSTPCRPLVRSLLTPENRTPASPAMLLISRVILLLKVVPRLLRAAGALLIILRSRVVVTSLALTFKLSISWVMVSGR